MSASDPSRRRFIELGGVTVATAATAAVFAACGGTSSSTTATAETTTTTTATAATDVTALRTGSSIERLAASAYEKVIASGVLKSPAATEAATLFLSQHQNDVTMLDAETKKAGGTPFDQPNPVLLQQVQAQLNAPKDEAAALTLALQLEQTAAATYEATVGTFHDASLNQIVMSVGGVSARRAAVLAGLLKQPQAPRPFQTADGAIAPGTGV